MNNAVGVDIVAVELQLRRFTVAPELLAFAQGDRVHEHVQLVDETVAEKGTHELTAARDVDRPVALVLELLDLLGVVWCR